MESQVLLKSDHSGVLVDSPAQRWLDEIEVQMLRGNVVDIPVGHLQTPGIYSRTMFAKAGTVITSMVHKTEHPFVLAQGSLRIFIEGEGVVELHAPYLGVTKPGTRRLAYVVEDVIWTTFHATEETDLERIEAALIEPHLVDGRNLHFEYLEALRRLPA